MAALRFIVTTICLFTSIASLAQADTAYKKLNELINSQRREKSRLRGILDGIYLKHGFERFKGAIQLLGDSSIIKYDEVVVHLLYTERPEYKVIFEKGLFYPSVITGNSSGGSWEKTKPDLSDSTNVFSSLSYYSLRIEIYNEIKLHENTNKMKLPGASPLGILEQPQLF
jgi:hypothetical protein